MDRLRTCFDRLGGGEPSVPNANLGRSRPILCGSGWRGGYGRRVQFRPAFGAVAVALVIMLAGCGSAPNGPRPTPSDSGPATPTASASIPADGVSLKELGFQHGPTDRLSLPRGFSLATSADQPDAVTLVISRPTAAELADYLRRTLPPAGFKIDSDLGETFTFSGFGWTGSFTGSGSSSALVLRPS